MLSSNTWRVALDALRTNNLRTILTMLSVVIGSASIVLVVTVTLTGKRYVLAQIEALGTNIVYAELVRTKSTLPRSDELSLADMEAVRAGIPQVVEAAGTLDIPQAVVVEGVERPVTLVGVTGGFQRIRNLVVVRGRFLDADDSASRSKACVISQELSDLLFPAQDPVGRSIRVGELTFTVIGVFRERVATFGQSEFGRRSVVIPFSLMSVYVERFISMLYVQASRPEDVPSVTRQVQEILHNRHRPGTVYLVQSLESLLESAKNISFALSVVLSLIAFFALTISGIGIMNIMLVTVSERTHEIGLRIAVGAKRREILSEVLLEAFLISATGGVIGILLAVLIPALVEPLLPDEVSVCVSGISIAAAFVVCCLNGVLFGFLPANRAAKLQPTDSLQYQCGL